MDLGLDRRPGRFKTGIVVYCYRPIEGPIAANLTSADFGGSLAVTAEQVCVKLASSIASLSRPPSAQSALRTDGRGRSSLSGLYRHDAGQLPPAAIGPAGIHLFGLYHLDGKAWLPPNELITLTSDNGTGWPCQSTASAAAPSAVANGGGGSGAGGSSGAGSGTGAAAAASGSASVLGADRDYVFRIRYRLPPSTAASLGAGTAGCATAAAASAVDSLGALRTLDEGAFCYLFAQCRHDFISNRMHEMYGAEIKAEACLGFASLDLVRIAFEENVADLAKVQSRYNWADMIPQCVSKQFNFAMRLKIGLKSKLPRSVEEHYREYEGTREPLSHSMRSYLKELLEKYVPRYCIETFEAACGYKIVVDPYDLKRPGIVVLAEDEDFVRSHSITDLFGVSVADCNLLLNFKNSPPLSLNMTSLAQARSLAALLDGYYRLMVNYHFSISDQVYSPMVKHWATFKCFGPVRRDWALLKFKRLNNNKEGTFLVKQRSTSFSEYVIFVQKMGRLVPVTIHFDPEKGRYSCTEDLKQLFQMPQADPDFLSVKELLRYYRNGNNQILRIANQIAPVSNDITSLMICHVRSSLDRGESEPSSLCSLAKPVLMSPEDLKPKELIGSGRFTEVYDASHNQEHVVIKKLLQDREKSMLQLFQRDTQRSMFWKHPYVLNILGICLSPFWVVMEKADLGPLDEFLRHSRSSDLQMYHFVLAAEQLGQALMYLDECATPHGDIRCKNVVVKYFDKCDEILVKLAPSLSSTWSNKQPLGHECNFRRLPWIAPERYTSLDNETIAADVFSFAMALWEIFSKGARPLANLLTFEEVKQFHEGHRQLPQPSALRQHLQLASTSGAQAAMVDRLQKLMQQNVDIEPLNRMQPPEVVKELRQIRQKFDRRPYDQMDVVTAAHVDGHPASTSYGLFPASHHGDVDNDTTAYQTNHQQAARRPLPDVPLERHVIRSQDITVHKHIRLGQGHYGEVYKATLHRSDGTKVEIAVKRLKSELSSSLEDIDRKAFLEFQQELKIMSELKHDHIVQVFGKCNYHNGDDPLSDSFLIVMEFVPNGCLRDYLKKNAGVVAASTKLKFAINIAKGMQFLHSKGIIHRDLAARNVLVTADPDVKISDFGLARCLEEKDYYRCSDHTALPALWCAPESLEMKKFFKSSDIWSYAVVLWELYTNGDKPELPCEKRVLPDGLLTIDPSSLLHALRTGKRLAKPCECDDKVYSLMQSCWNGDTAQRPDFTSVVHTMESIDL